MKIHPALLGLALSISHVSCSAEDPTHAKSIEPQELDSTLSEKASDISFENLGQRINTSFNDESVVTEGQIRPRRRHENDMDFSKYNPFYWEGRQSQFKVEDFTVAGSKKIRFTMTTEWPQNYIPTRGPDFSAIYSGHPSAADETMRSKFKINMRMKHIRDFRVFEATLDEGVFNTYPDAFKKGALLTFEFRFFMDESFSDWQKQKQKNSHNLSAYYSEFFRIRIGEAGLFIDDPHTPNAVPSPLRSSGGWTTIPTVRVEPWKALQQQATNITLANAQNFMTGRTWFHTDFETGEHVKDPSDDKPAIFYDDTKDLRAGFAGNAFNVKSCNTCHENNGTSLLPAEGGEVNHSVAKTFDKTRGEGHQSFGDQLQTSGSKAEGKLKLGSWEKKIVTLDDGTAVTLKKPVFLVESSSDKKDLGLSIRRPSAMIGMGLLEAVPADTLKKLATSNGGTYEVIDGKIGRFGWKADKNSLKQQIGAALKNDMGVTSKNFVELDCGNGCEKGRDEASEESIDMMEAYLTLLGVPPRMNPTNANIQAGEKIFDSLSCGTCHVKKLVTGDSKYPEVARQTIQPFTDLLLHDMGEGLADDSGTEMARKWRTAPLWGMKNVKHSTDDHLKDFASGNINILWEDAHKAADKNKVQFLHDGRAETLMEAILWHGGAAEKSVGAYKKLTKAQRESLEAYLWDL